MHGPCNIIRPLGRYRVWSGHWVTYQHYPVMWPKDCRAKGSLWFNTLLKTKPSPTNAPLSPRTWLLPGEDTLQISVELRSSKPFGLTQDSMPSQIKKVNLRWQCLTDLRMGLLLGQIHASTNDNLPQGLSRPHPQEVATMRLDVQLFWWTLFSFLQPALEVSY